MPSLQAIKNEAWRIYPHTFALIASKRKWHPYSYLVDLSKQLTPAIAAGGARFLVSMPPRHGKSEFLSHWVPIWFLSMFPERKIILSSYAASLSITFGRRIRNEIISNPLCNISLSQHSKSANRFNLKNGGGLLTAGVGGAITGQGADLFIIDDPYKNFQEANSELIRSRVIDWWSTVARTRLEPGASVIVIQTRWNEGDLIGHLVEQGSWTEVKLPAINENNEALCPERYSVEKLRKIEKEIGSRHFQSLFQQEPSAADGNIIKREWINFYKELPKRFDRLILSCDLTFTETESGSWNVIGVYGSLGSKIFLVDQLRRRMSFKAQRSAVVQMKLKYPTSFGVYIEEKANGAALIDVIKDEIAGVKGVQANKSKENRLLEVEPVYSAGNVFYPDPSIAPWIEDHLKEILGFPKLKHDDRVDAESQAIKILAQGNLDRLKALSEW